MRSVPWYSSELVSGYAKLASHVIDVCVKKVVALIKNPRNIFQQNLQKHPLFCQKKFKGTSTTTEMMAREIFQIWKWWIRLKLKIKVRGVARQCSCWTRAGVVFPACLRGVSFSLNVSWFLVRIFRFALKFSKNIEIEDDWRWWLGKIFRSENDGLGSS